MDSFVRANIKKDEPARMDAQPKKILVAEDDPASRMVLETLFKKWGYVVMSSEDGTDAWEVFQENPDIHIVVSDWMMPGMDGVEFCRLVRNRKNRRYTFFILLTAKTQIDDVILGLKAGADDFVTKPFNQYELKVRLRAGERIIDLEEQLAGKVEELDRANRQMHRDLDAAAAMQRSMLPPFTGSKQGIPYASAYVPSEDISGDLFNIVELEPGKLGIFIFDVSGHGVPAALQSVAMGRMLSPHDPHASLLLRQDPDEAISVLKPAEVADQLNTRFQSASSKGDFITFLYGLLDRETGKFTYTRAGHPAPVHIRDGKVLNVHDRGDIPIGIIPQYGFEENKLTLHENDRLYFYTDGLPEAVNPDGKRFSEKKMVDILAAGFIKPLDISVTTLMDEITSWQTREIGTDDMTILAIEYKREG